MSQEQDSEAKKALVADWFGRAASIYFSPFFSYPGARLVDLAGVKPGAQVLDICTGIGAVLFPATDALGLDGHVTGIDIAPEMVRGAATSIVQRGLSNAHTQQMDAERLGFPDASFDYVLCGFGIGFIPDLDGALKEMQRVLKPGGVLAVSTWAEGNELAGTYRQLADDFKVPQPGLGSNRLSTAPLLQEALGSAGCTNVKVTAEQVKVIFDSKQEYWAQRMPIEQLAAEELAADRQGPFRRAVFDILQDYIYVDGVHEVRNVLYAVATIEK